jgi:hypothetical protein
MRLAQEGCIHKYVPSDAASNWLHFILKIKKEGMKYEKIAKTTNSVLFTRRKTEICCFAGF